MTIVFFITSFTGCSSDNQPKQETTPITTKETTQTVIQETTQESLAGWRAAYKTVITDTLKECTEKYPNEIKHGGYGLYDFDNDNVPELFIKTYGTAVADDCINIYDFVNDEAVLLGKIQSAHSWVYGTDKEDSFLVECSWMSVSAWNICEHKNGEFISRKLASYYPDGFGDDIEAQENPLPDMGYEIKEIKYYNLDDLSSLK